MYDCVQFHGGIGYMRETAVERMTRDARILAIGGGATEAMLEEGHQALDRGLTRVHGRPASTQASMTWPPPR